MRTSMLALLLAAAAAPNFADERSSENRVFELRTYVTHPGRLDALHKRFREHTNRIFKKHGMTTVGYWVPQDEKDGKADTLIYILAFPSREAAKKSWADFQADPEWQKVRAESEKDGKIVKSVTSVFMESTDYSPVK
jgi:hypothetical protein